MNGPAPPAPRPPAPRPPSQSRSHANHVKASCTSPFTMPPPPPSQQRNHGNRSRDRNNTNHGTSLNNRFMPPPAPQPPSQSRSHDHVNAGTLPRMMPPPSRTMAHQHTSYRAADCVMINNGPHVDNPPSKTHFQDKQTHQKAGYTRHNPHHQQSFSSNYPFLHSTRHHSIHSARDTCNKHCSNPTTRQLHQQPTPEQISSHGNNVTNSSNKRGRTQNIAPHGVAAIDRNQNNASHGSTFNKRAKIEVKEEHCKGARASTSHGNARSILKKRPAGNQPPSASASASSSAAIATLISTTTSSLPNTSSDQKNTINPSLCTKQIAVEVNGSDKDNAVNHNETPPTAFVRNTSSSDQKNTINPSLFNKQISVEGNGFDKDNAVKQTETHIIFAVDFSGSMRGRKTRDLLEFIDNFLGQELAHQLLKVNKKKNSTCIVSLLVFSELATNTLATRTSLKRKDRIHSALNTAKTLIPKGHKVFTAGFKEAHRLASFHLDKKKDNNTVLIFLSDGQPCDLKHPPPLNSSIPMQSTTTYGTNKKGKNDVSQKRYPAAGHYIELMQQQEYNFNLHLVSLNNDSQKLPVSNYFWTTQ